MRERLTQVFECGLGEKDIRVHCLEVLEHIVHMIEKQALLTSETYQTSPRHGSMVR